MQRAGLFDLFILFSLSLISAVWAKINIVVSDIPSVNVSTQVFWSRDDDDPTRFGLQKRFIGQQPPDNNVVIVNATGRTTGTAEITFLFPGPHVLAVVPVDKRGNIKFEGKGRNQTLQVITMSHSFNVLAADAGDAGNSDTSSSASSTSSAISTTPQTDSSTTLISITIPSPSPSLSSTLDNQSSIVDNSGSTSDSATIAPPTSSLPPPTGPGTTIIFPSTSLTSTEASPTVPVVAGALPSSTSRVPIIVGSVLGGVIGLALVTILGIVVRRRLEKRRRPSFINARMVRSMASDERTFRRTASYPNDNGDIEAYGDWKVPFPNSETGRADEGKSYGFPIDEDQYPTLRFVPLTNRQMELEERILEWQSKLIGARIDDPAAQTVRDKIESLKQLQASDWAREVTDEVPPGLL